MKRKIWASAIALILTLVISCVALVACNGDQNSPNKTDKPDKPFDNPGDNLGGGGIGTLPDEVPAISDDVFDFSNENDLKDEGNFASAQSYTGSSTTLTIDTLGDYVLSGTYSDGVVINVADKGTVHIFLNNATITNDDGIALSNENKNASIVLTAMDGTQNSVSNASGHAVRIKGKLNINGSGKLSVTSTGKNGINVSKALKIADTTLEISSANHAISAQSVEAQNATITVTSAAKDGINAQCDDDTTTFPEDYSEGYVALKNSNYTCSVKGDGIQADTLVCIDGGNINITTEGNFISYANASQYGLDNDEFRYIKNGSAYKKIASDENHYSYSSRFALEQSAKGIKVGEIEYDDANGNEIKVTDGDYLISISGACTVTINSSDDAIHTNSGDVAILSGTITINTYDDGITSDNLTQISGGTINIQTSYEGIEGAYVSISGGNIDLNSSDDGINAASDDTSIKEYISISGGTIVVTADGDGLDSNGSILITGGTVIVHGPTSGRDAALDADSGIIIQGGTVYAASTLGMVETPSTNSTQYVLSFAQSTSISAGSTITIKDSNGNELLSVTTKKACQSIIVSLPNFEKNTSYGIYGNGTQLESFTISSIITKVGSSTSMGGGGFPGGGRPGGRP